MTIQTTLQQHFGSRYRNFKGDIGLELETETREDYAVPKFSFWDVKVDNSLRDIGREYVLKQPLDFEINFPKALEEFSTKTKGIPFIQDSITTSCHVHLNFLNDTFLTLGNFLTLYCLTENLLIRASGEDRLSNLYRLPICDAEETHQNMLRMFRGIKEKRWGFIQFDADSTKYGAVNLSSLCNFGSLEIRSFRGTTDAELIKNWVGTLHSMQKYARDPKLLPPQIILNYKDRKTEYLTDIFGPYRNFIRHIDEENLIEKNFWYAASLAYEIKEWDKLEHLAKPKKIKPKNLDETARQLFGRDFHELNADDQRLVIQVGEELANEQPAPRQEDRVARLNPYTGTTEFLTAREFDEWDQRARREGVGLYRPTGAATGGLNRFTLPTDRIGNGNANVDWGTYLGTTRATPATPPVTVQMETTETEPEDDDDAWIIPEDEDIDDEEEQ